MGHPTLSWVAISMLDGISKYFSSQGRCDQFRLLWGKNHFGTFRTWMHFLRQNICKVQWPYSSLSRKKFFRTFGKSFSKTFWKAFWPLRAGLDWTGERKLVHPENATRLEAWRESSAKRRHPFLLIIISTMFKSRIVFFLSEAYVAEVGATRVKNCTLQFEV